MYKVCLSDRALKQLKQLKNKDQRLFNEVIERLELLQLKQWTGGTRVKKLIGADLWEARLNKADRILFLIRNDTLYVQLVMTAHDDVNRLARSKQHLFNGDLWTIKVDQQEELPLPIVQTVYEQADTLMYHPLSLEDMIRFIETEDLSEVSLKVQLVNSQKAVLEATLPCLISGQAGSGKSTVLLYKMLHYLLMTRQWSQRVLFVTKNRYLLEDLKKQFYYLTNGLDEEQELQNQVIFQTIEDLLDERKMDCYEKRLTYEMFVDWFNQYRFGNRSFRSISSQQLYYELLGVIAMPLLTQERALQQQEYVALEDYEAPMFVEIREQVYSCYEAYVTYKRKLGFYDEIDVMRQSNPSSFELLVIDEVQDLHAGQLHFIFSHTARQASFIIAGDDKQAIVYEGFQWAKLKRQLGRICQVSHVKLNELLENFRNPQPIAQLCDSLFRYGAENGYTQLKYPPSYAVRMGETARIIKADFDIFHLLNRHVVMLVANLAQEQEIQAYCAQHKLEIPIILTIQEAKGLEFNEVWLWHLAEGLSLHQLQRELVLSIKQMYVAITRSMRQLFIVEQQQYTMVKTHFSPLVETNSVEVPMLIDNNNDEQLYTVIEKLFAQQQYARCYELLCRLEGVPETLQAIFIQVKGYELTNKGNFSEAAKHYEKNKYIDLAIYCYEQCGDDERIAQVLTEHLRTCTTVDEQYEHWMKKRDIAKVRNLDRKENWLAAARLSLRHGHVEEAYDMKKNFAQQVGN
jgi:mRNA-degrading endonuclease RelE of RelBE toxin-antitoxin system